MWDIFIVINLTLSKGLGGKNLKIVRVMARSIRAGMPYIYMYIHSLFVLRKFNFFRINRFTGCATDSWMIKKNKH